MCHWQRGLIFLLCSIASNIIFAQTDIPDALKPWQSWVLRNDPQVACPRPYNQPNKFMCDWPASLEVSVYDTNARFSLVGKRYQSGWVSLPGDKQHWPIKVTNLAQTMPVIERNGKPHVFVDAGEYNIAGDFTWPKMPDRFALPNNAALLKVSINDKLFTYYDPDSQGYIWLQKQQKKEKQIKKEVDSLQLKVYRKLQDSIPQEMLTLLKLSVTGKEREVSLGPIISDDIMPIYVQSALPTRLEKDGILRVNVRPGVWDIYVNSRLLEQTNQFELPLKKAPWPEEEVWVVEPQPQLRQIEMTGARSIDPTQTELPQHWRGFPTYLMAQGIVLTLDEKQRGKVLQRGENLTLKRQMWLDFDGKGMTIKDQMGGVIEDNWRLSAQQPLTLGRVSVNNEDQLITILPEDQQPGVEIRNGHLQLTAVSRINQVTSRLPAIGWNRDVNQLNTTLYLPPGWQLLHAMGVDDAKQAWLLNWNLLDLFLVLLISLSVLKLLGIGWGIFALLTLTMIYQETGAPVYSWLAVLAGLALCKVMPDNTAKQFVKGYTAVSLVALIFITIPFISMQIQTAIYPQLNKPDRIKQQYSDRYARKSQVALEAGVADLDLAVREMPGKALGAMSAPMESIRNMRQEEYEERTKEMKDYDPDAKVQTGPGVPNWQWHSINLNWHGPVVKDQLLRLWLLPAWVVSILKIIQVIFTIGLITAFARALNHYQKSTIDSSTATTTKPASWLVIGLLPILLWISGLGYVTEAVADIPDPAILSELRTHLLKAPECMPQCGDYNKIHILLDEKQLTLRVNVQAATNIAMPLPDISSGWHLDTILLNGKKAPTMRDDLGALWAVVDSGDNEILLTGNIVADNDFSIGFDIAPKQVEVVNKVPKVWSVTGVRNQLLTGGSIQFNRSVAKDKIPEEGEQANLQPTKMPPFVIFKRTIQLGHEWEVQNEIRRISPSSGVIHLKIPLLKDEKVLSEHINVQDNQMLVQLGQNQSREIWYTKLPIEPLLSMTAMQSTTVKEIWQIQTLPMWHVDFEGIPLIHQQSKIGQWLPQWHPWPNEQLQVSVIKPEALPGNTLTIDNSHLLVKPGNRKTEYALNINMRSSQGDQHTITLPEDIKIQDVMIQNLSQPINLEGRKLTFPVYPGTQQVTIKWESNQALIRNFHTPEIDLGHVGSNHITQVEIAKNRWILWVSGPEVGPVVRYWPLLILTILIAIGLGRSKLTPLATWQWALLGLGVTLSTPLAAIAVIAWFIIFELRHRYVHKLDSLMFLISQGVLLLVTGIFIISLLICITNGLLGNPQMQMAQPATSLVHSNFYMQTMYQLQWYQDKIVSDLPVITAFTIPIFIFRILMLAWALWLAFSLLRWLQWGWRCFSEAGIWRTE